MTVTARHTFKNTAVLYGSYTRSRASSDQVLDPILGALYFAPQQPGPLSWDAPNRVYDLGQYSHADLGNIVDVSGGLPHGLSVQRDQSATVSGGRGECIPVPEYENVTI